MLVQEGEQLGQGGGGFFGGVEQEQPGRPGVGAGLVRAGGDDVVVVVAGAVDGVDGVGQDLRGGVGAGGVGADPVGVDRRDLGRYCDAVAG